MRLGGSDEAFKRALNCVARATNDDLIDALTSAGIESMANDFPRNLFETVTSVPSRFIRFFFTRVDSPDVGRSCNIGPLDLAPAERIHLLLAALDQIPAEYQHHAARLRTYLVNHPGHENIEPTPEGIGREGWSPQNGPSWNPRGNEKIPAHWGTLPKPSRGLPDKNRMPKYPDVANYDSGILTASFAQRRGGKPRKTRKSQKPRKKARKNANSKRRSTAKHGGRKACPTRSSKRK